MTEAAHNTERDQEQQNNRENEQNSETYQEENHFETFYAQELDRLEHVARELVNEYWERYWENRETRPKSEWGNLGVRLQRRDTGVSIEWYKARFRRGEKKPMMIHIPRGKGYAYTPGAFKRARAKEWELEAALELEEKFAVIRRKHKMLSQMRRYYHEYNKVDLAGL